MLEGIALSLIKTMLTFMFEQYLHTTQEIKIDGAPPWYYQNEDAKICSYSVVDGDYRNIDILKYDLSKRVKKEIENINNRVIYENFDKIGSIEEIQIIEQFQKSGNLRKFVRFNIEYSKIEYEEEVNRVFGKGCIDKNLVISFNKKRLQKIVREISLYKSSKEFYELESGKSENRYFQELDAGF